jgi:DNA-binding HxlR family transcriptional regulator
MRTYGEGCAAAHALDLVGERWALLVVRELVLGPKRFTDLRAGIAHASPNVLAQRLRELEQAGVVRRRKLPPPAASWVYELTEWGAELEPVIMQLGRWGARSPLRPRDAGMSVDSLILALRTMFDPDAAGSLGARIELRLGEERFCAEVRDGRFFELERGSVEGPDASIEADPGTLAALIFEGGSLSAALRRGAVSIEGDRRVVTRFLRLFPLPELATCTPTATATAALAAT